MSTPEPNLHPALKPFPLPVILAQNNLAEKPPPCTDKQWSHIFTHLRNVTRLIDNSHQAKLLGFRLFDNLPHQPLLIAGSLHDIGKIFVPEDIYFKTNLNQHEVEEHFSSHPDQAFNILGPDFIKQQHPWVTKLIRWHHPYGVPDADKQPQDPKFIAHLFTIVVCDRIMAAMEIRPDWDIIDHQPLTAIKAMLPQKLQFIKDFFQPQFSLEVTHKELKSLRWQALNLRH